MSILYVGPYKQNDEWGLTSRAFATLLASQNDFDVAMRPVWFNGERGAANIPPEILGLEYKKIKNKEILIQYGLPSYLNYNGDFQKNVAVTSLDCRIDNTDWVCHLNLFDLVVVFSKYEKQLLQESGVTSRIYNFEFPPLYKTNEYHDLEFQKFDKVFYTQGSLNSKDGLREIIIAYLSEFSILDNTVLIVFSNDAEKVNQELPNIKKAIGKFNQDNHNPSIMLINSEHPSVLNTAHKEFDFFVSGSYNSRVTQDILKAISFGNVVVVPDTCNELFQDYDFYIETNLDSCFYTQRPIPYLYTGEFCWRTPKVKSIREKMRNIVEGIGTDRAFEQISKKQEDVFSKPEKHLEELLCIL